MAGLVPQTASDSFATPAVARAGRAALSLAMMDARNRTLQHLSPFEHMGAGGPAQLAGAGIERPDWLAGHIAWLAEYWIGRNPQRGLGAACPADSMRLASIEPQADRWFNPALAPPDSRWQPELPGFDAIRAYLLETLESTLEILDKTPEHDEALYFFRVALFHEELRCEQLASLAQAWGVAMPLQMPQGLRSIGPVLVPAGPWLLGSAPGGFVFDVEKWAYETRVPEFEIDAQPVNWAQFVEFVGDGGYDRVELWEPQGWQWLQHEVGREGRRGPRYVEQIGSASGSVLRTVFGKSTRMSGTQSAMHVTWWEAQAYARWAGRRLPTEVEWEMAAHWASGRGFRWGDVLEWTAGTLRPWPGFTPDAWTCQTSFEAQPHFGSAKVLRGASFATGDRLRDAKRRRFALPNRDYAFVGFRTCAP